MKVYKKVSPLYLSPQNNVDQHSIQYILKSLQDRRIDR